jgi:acetyl-CoA C-acetyltransferase
MSLAMNEVILAGVGQVPVGEHWQLSLRNLAARAMLAAIQDAGGLKPQAIYVGNYLASQASQQANMGALMAECIGLSGVEGVTTEAGEASGAAALHLAWQALRSGMLDTALVVGLEKYTDVVGTAMEGFIAQSADYDFEGMQGISIAGIAGLLMQRYLHEFAVPREAFAAFPILAHANAVNNPNAFYRRAITLADYTKAGLVSDPLNLMDAAPYADGAAAVLLTRRGNLPENFPHPLVALTASSLVTDTLSLHDRPNPLGFDAARLSADRAFQQAGIPRDRVDLFEYWDAFSIYALLCLEAAGYAEPGSGWQLGRDGSLELKGRLPVATLGGLKARGFPLGAAGVYQVADALAQLRGQAGANQVLGARVALVQSLGGPASTAVTHILQTL